MPTEKDKIVNYIMTNVIPIAKDEPILHQFLDDSTAIVHYQSRPDNLPNITKLQVFLIPSTSQQEVMTIGSMLVQVTYADKSKKLYRVNLSEEDLHYLQMKLSENMISENAFSRLRLTAKTDTEWDELQMYEESTDQFYQLLREDIKKTVSKNLPEENITGQILLIDVGTGLGDCLDVTTEELRKQHRNIKAVGIDYNAKNIAKASERFNEKRYEFEVGDTKNLENIIKSHRCDGNQFIIVTGSGAMTRLVLNNTIEVLIALQQAYRTADLVVLGGITEVLLTKRIAKQMGWHCDINQLASRSNIYTLSHQPITLSKIKNNHLDLSMHANPLEVLNQVDPLKLGEIVSIDLGLAYLQPTEITQVFDFLPQLKNINISGLETWSKILEGEAARRNIILSKNRSAYVDDELTDENSWELKRFSKNFYERYQKLLLSNGRVSELKQTIDKNPDIYCLTSFLQANIEKNIERLELRAAKDDHAAIYALAINFENGIDTTVVNKGSKYATSLKLQDLDKSLLYWSDLYAKGYPVLKDIYRVKIKITQSQNSFDTLKDDIERLQVPESEYTSNSHDIYPIHIQQLESLAAIGDDKANFTLAKYFEEDNPHLVIEENKKYPRLEMNANLEKSLLYWSVLLAKGYPVKNDVNRLKDKIASKSTFNDEMQHETAKLHANDLSDLKAKAQFLFSGRKSKESEHSIKSKDNPPRQGKGPAKDPPKMPNLS